VGRIPGINHPDAVRALEKSGFRIARQGTHIVMTDGVRILTIPRHDPINAFMMGGIVRDAGLIRDSPGECFVVILSAAKDLQFSSGIAPDLQILHFVQDDRSGTLHPKLV
jgi:hypothetical protein